MSDYPFTIIGKADCRWCDKAIKLLEERGHGFNYLSLELNPSLKTFLKCLDLRTVPQIWWHKEHIGGYNDLHYLLTGTYPPEG